MNRLLIRIVLPLLILAAGWRVGQQLRAAQIARHQPTPEGLLEAIRLDPDGPGYHFRLGVAYRDVPELRNPQQARAFLETAAELNPYNWRYHRELALLYELSGQIEEAESAFLRALDISPRSGSYRWRLANFYLRNRSLDQAIPQIKLALATDPGLFEPGLGLLLKAGANDRQIDRAWPESHAARRRLLRLLCKLETAPGEPPSRDFLRRLWDRLLAAAEPTPLDDGQTYVLRLITEHRFEEARARWLELAHSNSIVDSRFELGHNLIWNGDFERPLVQRGLGWRVHKGEGYSVTRVEAEGPDGSGSLRIAFDNSLNVRLANVQQHVLVEPGRTYQLTFNARAEALNTDPGVFFDFRDGPSDRQLLETEHLLGSSSWKSYAFTFVAQSPWIRVLLRRDPSPEADSRLGGVLWLDSIVLEELTS